MKISIVTSYYNRKQQFINTLKTISKSKQIENVEVIAVDDCSSLEHNIEDLQKDFSFLKVITLKPEDRWYINPCVPFNKAIKAASGDIIIIQNPECLHLGDIISDVVEKINNNIYLAYGAYSIDKEKTNYITDLPYENEFIFQMIKSQIMPISQRAYVTEGESAWYNHSIYRPAGYHFLSAITKENMDKLNGFDERYSNGIAFDDDEFLFRVKLMGLNVKIIDEPFVIHQWHYSENNFYAKSQNVGLDVKRNDDLFNNVTKKTTNWRVN